MKSEGMLVVKIIEIDRQQRLKPNKFLNGDVGFTLVNLNFGKQILVSPCGLPHYSFL